MEQELFKEKTISNKLENDLLECENENTEFRNRLIIFEKQLIEARSKWAEADLDLRTTKGLLLKL